MDRYEAYEDFITGSIRLMTWYVWKLAFHQEPPISISEALDKRVDILRNTAFYDGRHPAVGLNPPNEKWDNLKSDLEHKFCSYSTATNSEALEDDCWDILAPLILPSLRGKYEKIMPMLKSPYSCWRYSFLPKHHANRELTDCIDIHFYNAFCPESPFKPPQQNQVAQDLHQMLEDAKRDNPTAQTVACISWLNELPPFLNFFPDAWTESFEPGQFSGGTAGYWGQYMDRRGAFHEHSALKFRDFGRHPYTCGLCYCDINGAMLHLRKQI